MHAADQSFDVMPQVVEVDISIDEVNQYWQARGSDSCEEQCSARRHVGGDCSWCLLN